MYKKPRHYPIFLHFFSGAISSYPLYLFIFFWQMQLLHSPKKIKRMPLLSGLGHPASIPNPKNYSFFLMKRNALMV
jgi:hypothetical protein